MGTRKSKVTLHRVPLYILEDHLGFFFSKFVEVADVSTVKSKVGIATGNLEILITADRENFMKIPNVLLCSGCPISVVVDGCQPLCWSCWSSVKSLP